MSTRSADLAARQLALLARMAELEPPPCIIGGYAEDALLAGRVTRAHSDVDWLVPRDELPLRLAQAATLGFEAFDTWGESAPGEPFYLAAYAGDLLLEVGVVDDWRGHLSVAVHRLLFDVDGEEPPAGYRLLLPPDTFTHPPTTLDGVSIRPASPLALYLFRLGIASKGSFGRLSERQLATSDAIREQLLPHVDPALLVPQIEPLGEQIVDLVA